MPVIDMRALSQPGGVFDSLADTIARGGEAYFRAQDRKERNARLMRQLDRELSQQTYDESLTGAEKTGIVPPVETMAGLAPHRRALIEEAGREHLRRWEQGQGDADLQRQLRAAQLRKLEAEMELMGSRGDYYESKAAGGSAGKSGSSGGDGLPKLSDVDDTVRNRIQARAIAEGLMVQNEQTMQWSLGNKPGMAEKLARIEAEEWRKAQRDPLTLANLPDTGPELPEGEYPNDAKAVAAINERMNQIPLAVMPNGAGRRRGPDRPSLARAPAGLEPALDSQALDPAEAPPAEMPKSRSGGLLKRLTGIDGFELAGEAPAKQQLDREIDRKIRDIDEMDGPTMNGYLRTMKLNQPEVYEALKARLMQRSGNAPAR